MSSRNSQPKRLVWPLQWLAMALPLLVIGLGLIAVRPDWHAALHVEDADAGHAHHGHAHEGHSHHGTGNEFGCAIELFASGMVESVSASAVAGQPADAFSLTLVVSAELLLIASERLEPPGRAPPFAS